MQTVLARAPSPEAAEIGLDVGSSAPGRDVEDGMSSAEFHPGARDVRLPVGTVTVGAQAEARQDSIGALVVHRGHRAYRLPSFARALTRHVTDTPAA